MTMKIFKIFAIIAVMILPAISQANNKEPIFINLATNDPTKVLMALEAGRQYSEKGFPIVIYLNDKAVMLGVEGKEGSTTKERDALKNEIASGAIVNICPSCLHKYGLSAAVLLDGVSIGMPHPKS